MMKLQSGQTQVLTSPDRAYISAKTILEELTSFFHWWYIEMPAWYLGLIQRVATICDDTLSITLLIRTFFVPWHRDTSLVGRGFGIAMRIIYLPCAVVITAVVSFVLCCILIMWALLPGISLVFLLRTPFA